VNHAEIHIEIGNRRSADVDAGFRLYADLTANDADAASKWENWYDRNPFGQGVYAVAKHGDAPVGFYSLIPVEMQIAGRPVLGAKGECFVVAPQCRKAVFGSRAMSLPVALSGELHRASKNYGISCIFLVGTPAAAVCHSLAGAKTISYDVRRFFLPLRSASGQTLGKRCKYVLAARCAAVRRGLAAIRRLGRRRGRFEFGPLASDSPGSANGNLLVSDSEAMLEYRFPSAHYLRYSVADVHGGRAFLVFTMPRRGECVSLKHWSPRPIPPENLEAVVADVVRHAHRAKSTMVSIEVPASDNTFLESFQPFGFFHHRAKASVQIYPLGEPSLADASLWRFTNSHTGFLGFA